MSSYTIAENLFHGSHFRWVGGTILRSTGSKVFEHANEYNHYMPLSFVTGCTNLQKFELESRYDDALNDFKNLQHVNFSRLQLLQSTHKCPNHEYLIKFLERNGKNLRSEEH